MEGTIKAIEAEGPRDKVKVIIGGAPVTSATLRKLGRMGMRLMPARRCR